MEFTLFLFHLHSEIFSIYHPFYLHLKQTDEPFFFSPHFYFTLQNIRKSKRLRYKRATVPTEGDLATAKNKERVERAGIITDNTAGKRPRTAGRADSGATGSGATTTSEEEKVECRQSVVV